MFFDIIAIIIFFLAVLIGSKKGFIRTIFKLVTFVVSLIIAFWTKNFLADILMKLPFAQDIQNWVAQNAEGAVGDLSKLPFISNGIAEQSFSVTYLIMQIIAVLAIFIVVAIILSLISRLLTKVINIIKLGVINKLLGAVLGAINGYIIIYLLSLLSFSLSFIGWVANALSGSYIAHNIPNPITLLQIIF